MRARRICALILGLLMVFVLLSTGQPAASSKPKEFRGEYAYAHTAYLSETIGPRPAGSQGEQKAGDYIARKFREYGWNVSFQGFSKVAALDKGNLKKYSLINSRNVVAIRPGNSPKRIIIGAHYDSADYNVPGANDNASGVGVLLELARVLGQKTQDKTYVLVAFGAEEAGLVGSRYFAEKTDLSGVQLMVNLDMVGDGNIVAFDGGGRVSTPPKLLQEAYQLARQQGLKPVVHRDFMLMARDSRDGGTSDFSPFLDQWVPAIGLGQGGRSPWYFHQPADTIARVNPATLASYGQLVLDLIARADDHQMTGPWKDLYLTIDSLAALLVVNSLVIKLFVILAIALSALYLVFKRSKDWFALFWLVPFFLFYAWLAVLLGYVPEKLIGLAKGLAEPWFAFPGAYLTLHLATSVAVLYVLSRLTGLAPQKLFPRSSEVYAAGSLILLIGVTAMIAAQRWDFAAYFAFWLLITLIGRFKFGLALTLLAPLPIYLFHWQLLNSHLWSEFYRTASAHPLVFATIYGVGILPLMFGLAAQRTAGQRQWPVVSPRLIFSTMLCLGIVTLLLPAYTAEAPQAVTIREEWKEHKLSLLASSKDRLPEPIVKALGSRQKSKEIVSPLPSKHEPVVVNIQPEVVNMKNQRMVTLDVWLNYVEHPYLAKVKLRSEQPFTLVNGGEFFPFGKLSSKVKLDGEAVGGVYGLVLERTPPQPNHFKLYIRASGRLRFTLETQFPEQFVEQKFDVPKATIKYENWSVFVKDI